MAVFAVGLAGLKLNVAVIAPAATTTEVGTGAIVAFELLRLMVVPDGPAGPERVTVPVTELDPLP